MRSCCDEASHWISLFQTENATDMHESNATAVINIFIPSSFFLFFFVCRQHYSKWY